MQIFKTIPAPTIIQKKIQESFPEFFWDIDTTKLDMKDHYKHYYTGYKLWFSANNQAGISTISSRSYKANTKTSNQRFLVSQDI